MGGTIETGDFVTKFNELNEYNQKYIIAIQQALLYAQETEKAAKQKKCTSKTPSSVAQFQQKREEVIQSEMF